MTVLSPFVYWAQNEKSVFLKIDLKDVKDPKIDLEPDSLRFESLGVGAKGLNDYAFSLDFNRSINVKESVHKITDNRIEFTLHKLEKGWWPRLNTQTQKPVWLKIDHDRFQSEDLDEAEGADILQSYPDLYEQLQKQELGYRKENFKLVYMIFYNLFMFVGFVYVLAVIAVRYLRDGSDSLAGTYASVGSVMCFLNLTMLLEALHPIFGYVKGGPLMPLFQVSGRIFILIPMLEYEPRLQTMPVVFYLFTTWSLVEVIRYPYYISQLVKIENGLLTWLRYTVWIVLYPIGFTCEAVIMFRNMIFLEQSGRWSVELPNPLNFTFSMATYLRIHLLFLLIPIGYTLMWHMYKARQQKIGPKPSKQKKASKRL